MAEELSPISSLPILGATATLRKTPFKLARMMATRVFHPPKQRPGGRVCALRANMGVPIAR
jgi:hypothetical protein